MGFVFSFSLVLKMYGWYSGITQAYTTVPTLQEYEVELWRCPSHFDFDSFLSVRMVIYGQDRQVPCLRCLNPLNGCGGQDQPIMNSHPCRLIVRIRMRLHKYGMSNHSCRYEGQCTRQSSARTCHVCVWFSQTPIQILAADDVNTGTVHKPVAACDSKTI